MKSCALIDPKPDKHGHLCCDLCENLTDAWILTDFCESPEGLEARADALVAYADALPGGVTTEARAYAENLRRKAADIRTRRPFDENENDSQRLSGFRGYMS